MKDLRKSNLKIASLFQIDLEILLFERIYYFPVTVNIVNLIEIVYTFRPKYFTFLFCLFVDTNFCGVCGNTLNFNT